LYDIDEVNDNIVGVDPVVTATVVPKVPKETFVILFAIFCAVIADVLPVGI
jgi:hypothetical protein